MKRTKVAAPIIVSVLLTGCAVDPIRTSVPKSLVPMGEREVERFVASGIQTYECRRSSPDAARANWTYVASELEMTDDAGNLVGRHTFAPPIWEARDGSKLTGKVRARADAPQAGNGQWLLVSTSSVGGPGRFAGITSIQRLHTRGGSPPEGGCGMKELGAKERVPLIAEFVLFGK